MTSPNPAEGGVSASAVAPASIVPARSKRARWPLVVGVVLLVALVAAGATYTAINLPRGCGVFAATRHGVPCDVPLPAGATYERPFAQPGDLPLPPGATEQSWVFSVAHTSGRALHDFYAGQLAASGWACVQDSTAGLPNTDQVFAAAGFTASKDTRVLFVDYHGDTGEVFIVVDDLHAAAHLC